MDYKSIGRNIRAYRESEKITRDTFAEMTDLSVSYVSALERGEKLPKLETFIRIANALQISSDILLSDVLAVKNQIVSSDLSQRLSKLPLSEQRRILNVLNTMIADSKD